MKNKISRVALAALLLTVGAAHAQDKTLRLITWADYVPKDVMEQFTKETGIKVEVTLSNNEEMISKLRATAGAGFDLAQPSQDRTAGPQAEFGIYKPMDLSKIKSEQFIPSMLEATRLNTTVGGKVYAVPHIWGTDGLVVNTKTSKAADYTDLCAAENAGKVSMRLKRPTLIAFAFSMGKNPFALYSDAKAYGALMDDVGKALTECKKNVKFYWDGKDQLLAGMRSGELTTAMMWDTGGWGLNKTNPDIKFVKVNTDEEGTLAGHFGIRSIPTLMVFREQVIVFQQAGALPRGAVDDLLRQVRELDMAEVKRASHPHQAGDSADDSA